ncbi:uncharacterized protein PAC_13310 [Phialocephala subalpina]|uniref:Uncharacterized protein n=1 Tax=Phialocephala subalpina TaxID=576137 RepID=A0A1L7XEG6_9HELO|nr:uncharacterized protein PAC_13310 [Phialocephala subalpina]
MISLTPVHNNQILDSGGLSIGKQMLRLREFIGGGEVDQMMSILNLMMGIELLQSPYGNLFSRYKDDAQFSLVWKRWSTGHGLGQVQRLAIPGVQTDLLQSAAVILLTLDLGQLFTSVDTPLPFHVLVPAAIAALPPNAPTPPPPNGVQVVMPMTYRDHKSVDALVQSLREELLALQRSVLDDGSQRSQMLLALFPPVPEKIERYTHRVDNSKYVSCVKCRGDSLQYYDSFFHDGYTEACAIQPALCSQGKNSVQIVHLGSDEEQSGQLQNNSPTARELCQSFERHSFTTNIYIRSKNDSYDAHHIWIFHNVTTNILVSDKSNIDILNNQNTFRQLRRKMGGGDKAKQAKDKLAAAKKPAPDPVGLAIKNIEARLALLETACKTLRHKTAAELGRPENYGLHSTVLEIGYDLDKAAEAYKWLRSILVRSLLLYDFLEWVKAKS